MQAYLNFGMLLLVAMIGGFLGSKLKLPGATLMGAMVAVIIFKAFASGDYQAPKSISFLIQIIVGMMVGPQLQPGDGAPAGGFGGSHTGLHPGTAAGGAGPCGYFCQAGIHEYPHRIFEHQPGGHERIDRHGFGVGCNATVVVAFHFFRVVIILLSAPFVYQLLRWWLARHGV